MRLDGKTAVVTGTSPNIGGGIAEGLAAAGANVVCVDSNADNARDCAAYLQSILAVQWLEDRTSREERARLLARIGEGYSIDQALYEAVGADMDGLDAALQQEISSEFPSF